MTSTVDMPDLPEFLRRSRGEQVMDKLQQQVARTGEDAEVLLTVLPAVSLTLKASPAIAPKMVDVTPIAPVEPAPAPIPAPAPVIEAPAPAPEPVKPARAKREKKVEPKAAEPKAESKPKVEGARRGRPCVYPWYTTAVNKSFVVPGKVQMTIPPKAFDDGRRWSFKKEDGVIKVTRTA